MAGKPEQRSALAVGAEWASKVSTIAMGFSLPALVGFGLDRWFGSGPVFTLIGVLLGFVSGLMQMMRLAREIPGRPRPARAGPKPDAKVPKATRPITENNQPEPDERRN